LVLQHPSAVPAIRAAAFLTLFDHNPPQELRIREPALLDITRAVLVAAFLGAISVATGGAALAQNLDQGKPAPKLFADGCATCHHSARGLAKGRFSLTLYLFLQDHYASNSSSAWALTSYLESVDSAPRGRSRAAAAKASPPATSPSRSSLRPPAAVPTR
jgi:hypothetical protein